MAGPTPVSALIHAATMVAAGVYLVGRFFPVFTHDVLLFIAYTGGITLFIAATIAMVQIDYKKVLAYSTVSQLGFMMLALGVGGWAAGLFHLLTHAFFKALLFLGAGSVYHSVHTYEMPPLGGLLKKMPITAWTMLIGTLAISGVPFFSGFYSKDAILAASLARVVQNPEHFMLFVFPAVGAILTAFYMFRMWFLTFAGEPRGFPSGVAAVHAHAHDEEHALDAEHGAAHGHGHGHDLNPVAHAHESEPIMTWPLIILAVCSHLFGLDVVLCPAAPVRHADPGAHARIWRALPRDRHRGDALLCVGFIVRDHAHGDWFRFTLLRTARLSVLRSHAFERRTGRGAIWRRLSFPGSQVVLRRVVLGRARETVPGAGSVLPRDRSGFDRPFREWLRESDRAFEPNAGGLRHDRRRSDRQLDGPGRLCGRRLGSKGPDRPSPQLSDVFGRRPRRLVCRRARLGPRLGSIGIVPRA